MNRSTVSRAGLYRQGSGSPTFDERLLALGVASFEHAAATTVDDGRANEMAMSTASTDGGPVGERAIERRIVARAHLLPIASSIAGWLVRIRGAGRAALIVASVVVALLGWAAAQAALGLDRSRPTNIYWLLGGVLLPQTLILVGWLLLNLFAPASAAAVSLGGVLRAIVARLAAGRLGREPSAAAAGAAVGLVYGRGGLARWTIGVATNALWTSFNVGCLAAVIVLLALQQHEFCWESTLLSSAGYERFTRAVAWLPHQLGFATPDSVQIAAARFDPTAPERFMTQDDDARAAWSGLLVGSVVTYGLAPRLMLLGLCMGLRRRARARFTLDLQGALLAPTAAKLAPTRLALEPGETPGRGISWQEPQPRQPGEAGFANGSAAERSGVDTTIAADGPPVVVALELPASTSGWPPASLAATVVDLGRIESREDRRAVLDRLRGAAQRPRRAIVIGSLASTPDRGLGHTLGEIAAAVGAERTRVVLSGGESLRGKGGMAAPARDVASIAQRVADWRLLARHAGIDADHVVEIDLDLLTAESAARLRGLLGDGQGRSDAIDPAPRRHLEQTFALIAATAAEWPDEPPLEKQAELHRQIARLYAADERAGGGSGRLARVRAALGGAADHLSALDVRGLSEDLTGHVTGDLIDGLRSASQRMTSLLPDALRRSPRWLAAGALAGALGCVAAATVAAPIAIASLPMWSVVGAAVGGALAMARSVSGSARDERQPHDPDRADWATGVRAAALFAVLLEFQGGGEARIAATLERAFPEPDPSPPAPATLAGWLDGVRHRVDLALTAHDRGGATTISPGAPRLLSPGDRS